MKQKSSKIFISHSTLDKGYVSEIVGLFEDIGLNEQQIFCSTVTGYDIPLDEDIYEHLNGSFKIMICMLSLFYQIIPSFGTNKMWKVIVTLLQLW